MARRAFTIVELINCLAMIATLVGISIPSLKEARARARLAACAYNMHQIGVALGSYACQDNMRLPPFAFSDFKGNLPLSGHYGGSSKGDALAMWRMVGDVNLHALVAQGMMDAKAVMCPSAGADFNVFAQAEKCSSYCMRFPFSEAVFATAGPLAYFDGTLLGVYSRASGGKTLSRGAARYAVPQLRTDRSYKLDSRVQFGSETFEPAASVLMSDMFWFKQEQVAGSGSGKTLKREVRAGWCHNGRFNFLRGDGSVQMAQDAEELVESLVVKDGQSPADDGMCYASYAEQIWQRFENR